MKSAKVLAKPEFAPLEDGRLKVYWPSANVELLFSNIDASLKNMETEFEVISNGITIELSRINMLNSGQRYYCVQRLQSKKDWNWDDAFVLASIELRNYFSGGDEIINLNDVTVEAMPPALVDPIVENTLNVWAAHGSTGKSVFALATAIQVSKGMDILGQTGYEPQNVLILDYEENTSAKASYRNRLINNGHPGYSMSGDFCTVWYRNEMSPITRTAPNLKRIIKKRNIGYVIIDSLGIARGGSAENSSETIAAMNAINYLGIPSLVLDHLPQKSKENSGSQERPFGSVYTRNLARSLWTIESDKDDKSIVTFSHRKANHRKLSSDITYNFYWEKDAIVFDKV